MTTTIRLLSKLNNVDPSKAKRMHTLAQRCILPEQSPLLRVCPRPLSVVHQLESDRMDPLVLTLAPSTRETRGRLRRSHTSIMVLSLAIHRHQWITIAPRHPCVPSLSRYRRTRYTGTQRHVAQHR